MISVHFQVKPFNVIVIQVYALTSNAEETEVERFYEDLQDLLELTSKKHVLFIIGDWNANAKECSNYHTIALISHASKVMLKILQARMQKYLNREFPDVQFGIRKGRGTRDQIANICWIIEKASSRKIYISVLLTMPKP